MPAPSDLRLTGATVLRDGTLQKRSVAIEGGRVSKGPLPEVDLRGYLVLPGIIDLFGARLSDRLGPGTCEATLHALDREAATHGVTTGWLAFDWSWEGGTRGPDHADRSLQVFDDMRKVAMTDLQALLLCETHTADTRTRLLETVRARAVTQVVFTNTLDEARTAVELDPLRLALRAGASGLAPEDLAMAAHLASAYKSDVPRFLYQLAEAFDTMGVSYGSLSDKTGESREYFSQIGAKLCVCPERRAAAALARAVGDPVMLCAQDILSSTGLAGLGTRDLIRERLCDAMISCGAYASLVQAAFALVDGEIADLPTAWALLSSRPAEILRLPDRGVIDYGRRADLTVINEETRCVEATIVGGSIAYLAGEAARRFLGARSSLRLAAE